jgi:hypothetical protein
VPFSIFTSISGIPSPVVLYSVVDLRTATSVMVSFVGADLYCAIQGQPCRVYFRLGREDLYWLSLILTPDAP